MVRVQQADPDLLRYVGARDREGPGRLGLPVVDLDANDQDIERLLEEQRAFGALVLEGMLLCRWRVGDQVALGVLGPGDVVSSASAARSILLTGVDCTAIATARLALLGEAWLTGVRRWPQLGAGLQARVSEQYERLGVHLAICQIPRVEDRLLAVLWLLAETWGHVTTLGTMLPLSLTHETLGGLVGARRPTVTLALGQLVDRGAIVRHDSGWLLVELPQGATGPMPDRGEPVALNGTGGGWSQAGELPDHLRAPQPFDPVKLASVVQHLAEVVERLSAEHPANVEEFHERLERFAASRERCRRTRRRISRTRQAISRRRAPS
jgi:CRP/FNR family transcriptional regulator, cyclic AMP receptor protein